MKEKLLKQLIKNGNNPQDAEAMVEEHFDYLMQYYSTATASKLAEIIICLH